MKKEAGSQIQASFFVAFDVAVEFNHAAGNTSYNFLFQFGYHFSKRTLSGKQVFFLFRFSRNKN
ncbi:hypothetical protein PAENIP36_53010 [Paenibacillus sp. P36]